MTCARTGWPVEARARVMNCASRSFNLRNVLRFIKVVSLTGPARESFVFARALPSGVPLDNTQTRRRNQADRASAGALARRGAETAKGSDHLRRGETLSLACVTERPQPLTTFTPEGSEMSKVLEGMFGLRSMLVRRTSVESPLRSVTRVCTGIPVL